MDRAREVAKKLWETLGVTKRRYPMQPEEAEKEIVAALRAHHIEERNKEHMPHGLCGVIVAAEKTKARSVALEEAEKIVRTPIGAHPGNSDGRCYKCDCHSECPQDYYGDEIRRLRDTK